MENKGVVIGIIIALIVISALVVFFMQDSERVDMEISFQTIEKGFNNDINERQTRVIKTTEEWRDLWTEMFSSIRMPTRVVDFDNKMLIAAIQGQKLTGGYNVEIDKIEDLGDKINVNIVETEPGSNCITTQAFTSPYHIVELDKTSKKIEFSYSRNVVNC